MFTTRLQTPPADNGDAAWCVTSNWKKPNSHPNSAAYGTIARAGPRSSVAPPVEHDRERHSLLASVTKANLRECDRASITCSQTAGIAKGRPFENLLKPGIFVRPIEARCSPGAAELGVVLLRRNNRQRPDKIQPPSSQSNRCSKSRPNSQTARDR